MNTHLTKNGPILFLAACSTLAACFASAACDAAPPVGANRSAATLTTPVDAARDAQILGASPDARYVAYATPCDSPDGASPQLKILDDWTGIITPAGPIAGCRPGALTFSRDGQLAAFPAADGVVAVWSAHTRKTAIVSRPSMHGIAVAFAPDSRWLVVASAANSPVSTLDAWDADLVHHDEIATTAFVNPFGRGSDAVRFSPDGSRLLFLGEATSPFPLGTLLLWRRATRTAKVLAKGVAAYAPSSDFGRVAYLGGVVFAPGPPSVWLHGDLAVQQLASGRIEIVESNVAAAPQLFTLDGTLLYLVGPPGGPSAQMVLKAAGAGTARVLDTGVLQAFAPSGSVVLSPDGASVAYLTAFDPMRSSGELHVATVTPFQGVAPVVASHDAVPLAFGWTVCRTLGFLHAPSTGPFSAVGTLAAWAPGSTETIAREVAQTGLSFDVESASILFVRALSPTRGGGDLAVWSASGGRTRHLARGVLPRSVQISPDESRAGALVTTGSAASPSTALVVASLHGPDGAQTVAEDVTTFAIGDGGRVLYTTSAGLFEGFAF